MLEDRDYMRQPVYHEPRISWTIVLLIVNAVVFVIQLVGLNFQNGAEIENEYFALSLYGLEHYRIWQLLTFQFMHAGFLHILFNSLAIFFFGRTVETIVGARRFLTLYFCSGIIGGSLQMLFALCLPDYFGGAVVGASAGAFGLVAAFAVIYWEQQFTLLFYFIIPIAMRGRTLFWGSIIFTIIFGLIPNTGVANAAHLGGILTGFFLARRISHGGWQYPLSRSEPPEFVSKPARKKFWSSAAPASNEDLSAEEFLQKEVDPILEKISAHGIQSLTSREREILEKARTKMTKR